MTYDGLATVLFALLTIGIIGGAGGPRGQLTVW